MNNEREQQFLEIENQIKALPIEAQNAVAWIIKNIETVEQLTEGESLSEADAKYFIERAKEKNDYLFMGFDFI